VRCDVAIGSRLGFDPETITPRTGSVKNAVYDHPAAVWACTNQPVGTVAVDATRLSDCRKPHLYEATGNLIPLEGLTAYPSADELAAEEGPCRRSLTEEQRSQGLAVKTVWDPPSELHKGQGGGMSGLCWRYRTDGGSLPAMH
jgi:hypothetical protein